MISKFSLSSVATVLAAAANFIAIPILLSYFGEASFGHLAKFFVFIALLPLFEFGLVQACIQHLSSERFLGNLITISLASFLQFLGVSILFVGVVSFLIFSTSDVSLLVESTPISQISNSTVLMIATFGVRILIPYLTVIDYVNNYIVRITLLNLIFTVLRTLGLALFCQIFDLTIHGYLTIFLIISIIEATTFLTFRLKEWVMKRVPNSLTVDIRVIDFIPTAVKVWCLVLSWNGLLQFERLMLGTVLTPTDFGIIWTISTFAAAVMLVSAPLSSFALPLLNRTTTERLEYDFLRVTRTYAILIFCPTVLGLIYQREIFEFWLGIQLTKQESLIFCFYLTGNSLHILAGFAYFLRYRLGLSHRFIIATTVFTLSQALMMYFCAMQFGAMGTSTIWLIYALFSVAIFALPKIKCVFGSTTKFLTIITIQITKFAILIAAWKLLSSLFIANLFIQLFSGVAALMLLMFITMRENRDEYI